MLWSILSDHLRDQCVSYSRARCYNPQFGRFVSEDPIGFADGINVYAYAGDSPTNFTDPFGRVARSCIEQAYSKHLPNCSEGGPLLAVFCKGRVLTALTLLVFLPASSSRQCHSPALSPSVPTSNLISCSTATGGWRKSCLYNRHVQMKFAE